ncbi:hypothetical protein IF1G_01892 [Cordyceps javanica]|uniref:Uncharacterized protein n=1 Tax=Cordyceps javanica TaxID=43265 RepID=A0A545VD76_9HYPO|nr:hypothetical protein IF1G_01892 [Cordyceps javanica]
MVVIHMYFNVMRMQQAERGRLRLAAGGVQAGWLVASWSSGKSVIGRGAADHSGVRPGAVWMRLAVRCGMVVIFW